MKFLKVAASSSLALCRYVPFDAINSYRAILPDFVESPGGWFLGDVLRDDVVAPSPGVDDQEADSGAAQRFAGPGFHFRN